jgi:hypothetical protein
MRKPFEREFRCKFTLCVVLLLAHAYMQDGTAQIRNGNWKVFGERQSMTTSWQGGLDSIDTSALVSGSDRNGSAMHQRINEYTYTMKFSFRKSGKRGKVEEESKTYEVYIPSRLKQKGTTKFSLILIEKNGTPIAPERVERERRRAGEELEKSEREALKQSGGAAPPGGQGSYFTFITKMSGPFGLGGKELRLSPSTILRKCEFGSPRPERIDGRDVIALQFRQCSPDGLGDEERYISNLAGKVWIDSLDRVLIRLEGWPRAAESSGGSKASSEPASAGRPAVMYEQVRLAEGVWFPQRALINTVSYKALFGIDAVESLMEFSDYKRFSVEVKDEGKR